MHVVDNPTEQEKIVSQLNLPYSMYSMHMYIVTAYENSSVRTRTWALYYIHTYRIYSNSSRPRIVAAHSASAKNKSRPRIVAAVNYIHSAMSYGGHARSYTYVRTQLLRVRARARYWRAVIVAALE